MFDNLSDVHISNVYRVILYIFVKLEQYLMKHIMLLVPSLEIISQNVKHLQKNDQQHLQMDSLVQMERTSKDHQMNGPNELINPQKVNIMLLKSNLKIVHHD